MAIELAATKQALTYRYRIQNVVGADKTDTSKDISGLLGYDKGDATIWDTDSDVGATAKYNIIVEVDLEAASDTSKLTLESFDTTFDFAADTDQANIYKWTKGADTLTGTEAEATASIAGGAWGGAGEPANFAAALTAKTSGLEKSSLFKGWDGATVEFGSEINYATSKTFSGNDQIRVTGATLTDLAKTGAKGIGDTGIESDDGYKELFTIKNVSIDQHVAEHMAKDFYTWVKDASNKHGTKSQYEVDHNGGVLLDATAWAAELAGSANSLSNSTPLWIDWTNDTNIYDTVVSKEDVSTTKEIATLKEITGETQTNIQGIDAVSKDNRVSVHEAASDFSNLGTTFYTQRYIGSSDKTFLVRSGGEVTAESYWANVGTYKEDLSNVRITQASGTGLSLLNNEIKLSDRNNQNRANSAGAITHGDGTSLTALNTLDLYAFNGGRAPVSNVEVAGMDVKDSAIDGSGLLTETADGIKLDFTVKVAEGNEGKTLSQLDNDFFKLTAHNNGPGGDRAQADGVNFTSNNRVTYQSDINYDGRVSMKDVAFLNAGRIKAGTGLATTDVDVNFDGYITLSDLTKIDSEWGKSIHSLVTDADVWNAGTNTAATGTAWDKKVWSNITANTENTKADDATAAVFSASELTTDFTNSAFETQQNSEADHATAIGYVDNTTAIAYDPSF